MEPVHIIGAIFVAYIVVKEVFVLVKGETKQIAKDVASLKQDMLTQREDNKTPADQISSIYKDLKDIRKEISFINESIEDLYKWHDKEDDDGVKIWYVRKTLEDKIKKLVDILDKQRETLSSLTSIFESIKKEMSCLREKLPEGTDKIT